MVATSTSGMLDRNGVIAYVGQNASTYGLDPAAVLSVANGEGLNTAPGATWNLSQQFGERGYNFGPPSWYSLGAGGTIVGMQGSNAPQWAWTPAGLDYWLSQVAQSASGLTGGAAIQAIVHGFERPLERLRPDAIQKAENQYSGFQRILQGIGIGGGVTDTQPTETGTVGTGAEAGVQGTTGLQTTASSPGEPTKLDLDFSKSIQHSIMQILLVIFGLALLLGGIYLIGSRR